MECMLTQKLYNSRQEIKRVKLKAPKTFCIYSEQPAPETFDFLRVMQEQVYLGKQYIELDFTETTNMTGAAILILFAQASLIQYQGLVNGFQYPDYVVLLKSPAEMPLYSLFKQTGLWSVFKPGEFKKIDGKWETPLPLKTGQSAHTQAWHALNWIETTIGAVPTRMPRAVQEAFLNIKYHSYGSTPNLPELIEDRWWQYSYVERNSSGEKVLKFLVYDVGIGIPESVRKFKQIVYGDLVRDDACIELAMKKGFSTSGKEGRGIGSEDIKRLTMVTEDRDRLCIWSGCGFVMYENGMKVESKHTKYPVGGTLIEWSLAIEDSRHE